MPRPLQRADHWSLRQVALVSGVSEGVARRVVRQGHLDPDRLTAADALLLRVAAVLAAVPVLSARHAADAAVVQESTVLQLLRPAGLDLPVDATLVLTCAQAPQLAMTLGEVCAAALLAAQSGTAYVSLPIGLWALELRQETGRQMA